MSRDFALPRNSCRSLRKNSYQEKNTLSVCCFDGKTRRLPALLDVGKSTGEFFYTLAQLWLKTSFRMLHFAPTRDGGGGGGDRVVCIILLIDF